MKIIRSDQNDAQLCHTMTMNISVFYFFIVFVCLLRSPLGFKEKKLTNLEDYTLSGGVEDGLYIL